ncbi:phosphorylase family protein [Hyalangium versicolor]|uniref:phosphorylase family protein n=1 Tax=Hyalangium versicolor TaxID=2861190 RepID=UPI001CCC7FC0|nr:NACHT domain-containing protein [Hyalangium versicolor]
MPQETRDSHRHDGTEVPPRVDVLIITALKVEYDAVLDVHTGACSGASWKRETGPTQLEVAFCDFQTAQGGRLRIAVTQAANKGPQATAIAAGSLVSAYSPRCLAMCGVCAGYKGKVQLGDVIVADVVWDYESGKLEQKRAPSKRTVTHFRGRGLSYPIRPQWKLLAERFKHPTYNVHVGSIATGNKVIRVPKVFELLSERHDQLLGLDMEAATIGELVHFHRIEHMLVMKGVSDFGDPAKSKAFQPAAARAAAECLLAFLREHLPSRSEVPSQEAPDPRAREEALAQYKRAREEDPSIRCLNLRGLVGIAPGEHQTELDLLDFAVAPSLHDASEAEGSREALLRHQLSSQELEPDRRRKLERELDWLERQRWDHHGGRNNRPISFARSLHGSRRFVIIGDPGAGKSVLTRLALLACAEGDAGHRARVLLVDDRYDPNEGQAIMSLRGLLPVRLTLGTMGSSLAQKERALEECIRQELLKQHASPALVAGLGALLMKGRIFLILDGLDEVPDRQRGRVVDAVTELAREYPEVRILATSRPTGYAPRIPGLGYTRLAPLHERQQHTLVSRLHHLVETRRRGDEQDVERARRRTSALLRAIQERDEWQEVTSNPLMLTLCTLTSAYPEGLPKHRVFLYENFMRTLLVEWRPGEAQEADEQLLKVWTSVSSTLIQQEQRGGVMEGYLLGLLGDALAEGKPATSVEPETALRFAIERGLVTRQEETISFWHSTFGEYLAARALTLHWHGAAERLLSAEKLTTKVLQFAAARLKYVLTAPKKEMDALAEGLLARDTVGAGRLRHPGLRAVSSCLADGVRFSPEIVHRVWNTWAELLESTPPSPLWEEFGQLTRHTPRPQLPASLVERLARVEDQGLEVVQLGLARLVAPEAENVPPAGNACERWLEQSRNEELKLHAAYGLAAAGHWNREGVIETLGRFAASKKFPHAEVGHLVQQAPAPVLEQLRECVRLPPPSEEDSREQAHVWHRIDEQLSAACLLAVGGQWDEDVARVLKRTLEGKPSLRREDEAKAVVRSCADEVAVQTALLDWISEDSTLGRFAREIVGDVAALFKDMPRGILERTLAARDRPREELESLLVSIAQERPAFIQTLQRCLAPGEGPHLERGICAGSLMLRIAPRDARFHEALQRGMRSKEELARAHWAHLALYFRELCDTALATLQSCARSPDPVVRMRVYEGVGGSRGLLSQEPLDGWYACASDRSVPDAARFDAVEFLSRATQGRAKVVPILRELLDTADLEVRRKTLSQLHGRNQLDAHAAVLAAEDAARSGDERSVRALATALSFAPEVIPTFLRALPLERPSPLSKEEELHLKVLERTVTKVAEKDPACMEFMLDTLQQPGMAAEFAEGVLYSMMFDENVPLQRALQKRFKRAAEYSQHGLRRLVAMGLARSQTRPFALKASRSIALHELDPHELSWFALRIDSDVPEVSISMWRETLSGKNPKLLLLAAAKLLLLCPEKAHTWIQPAIERVLASPDPSDRLDAARLSLACGFLEQEAQATLLACLDSTAQDYQREHDTAATLNEVCRYPSRHAFHFQEEPPLMVKLLLDWNWLRIDFIAMYAVYNQWPDLGLERLGAWLEGEDLERFICAVKFLSTRDDSLEAVRVALERRLGSAPSDQLERLIALVEEHGFFSTKMAEQVLARYHSELPPFDRIELSLMSWLNRRPELWSLIRRQEPERRAALMHLLDRNVPITRDAVSLLVERAFAHPEQWLSPVEVFKDWFDQPEMELGEKQEEPHAELSEEFRGWLREALDELPLPHGFTALLVFDKLGSAGEVSLERRIEVLRHALDIDIASLESDDVSRSYLLHERARVGLRLVELGCRDERIGSVLESALRECTALYTYQRYRLAHALLKLRQVDKDLRELLIQEALSPFGSLSLSKEVEFLEKQVGLSHSELIEILIARLQSHTIGEPTQAPSLFGELERLGCEPERRASLLLDFVSRCGSELPDHTSLALADRPELSASSAAKLMLGALVPRRYVREVTQQWLKRFAPEKARLKDTELFLLRDGSHDLSLRLKLLAHLSKVTKAEWLEQLLAELVATPSDTLLALYRRARGSGKPLTDTDWAELTSWLTVRPDDSHTTRLGKEWLNLALWQKEEPSTVSALLEG